MSKSYKKIPKTYKQLQEERRYGWRQLKPEPELETKAEPEHEREPELRTKPELELGPIMPRWVLSRATKLVLFCILYLVVFGGAEFVTYYITKLGGIIFYFIILFSLITTSAAAREEAHRGIWLALGLVPLIRILSLNMPVAEISEIYWYIIISIPIFIGIFAVMRTLNFSLDDVGFNTKKISIQALVAVTGIGFGIIDYSILKPEALVNELTVQMMILPALILLIATGFVEELTFRGVMQRAARTLGPWGWVYIAIVYAVLQIGHGSAMHCVFAFIVALFFGWVVKKTGSFVGVSLSHGLLNVVLYLIFPHMELYLMLPHFF